MKLITDKFLHFLVSYALILTFALFFPIQWAIIISLTIGVLKEAWDSFSKKGSAEWEDLIADELGILAGIIVQLIGS